VEPENPVFVPNKHYGYDLHLVIQKRRKINYKKSVRKGLIDNYMTEGRGSNSTN
jgi:hypothetical protein